MIPRLRLALALFRTSWLRSALTVLGVGAASGIVAGVLLVMNAFQVSADQQVQAVFTRFDYLVSSPVGAPLPDDVLADLMHAEGVEQVLPFGQRESRLDGTPVLLVTMPMSEADAGDLARVRDGRTPVAMSTALQAHLGLRSGSHATLTTEQGALPVIVVGSPTGEGQRDLDAANVVVASASTIATVPGFAPLAQPNTALIELTPDATPDDLSAVVADHPGLGMQDQTQARDALLAGLRSLLETLPLVALVSLLLGVVLVYAIIRTSTVTQRSALLLLRALGASAFRLRGFAIVSALAHALVGVGLGLLIARPLAQSLLLSVPASIRNSAAPVLDIAYTPAIVGTTVAGVAAVSAVSAWLAVRPLLRASVDTSFRQPDAAAERQASRWWLAPLGVLIGLGGIAAMASDPRRWWLAALVAIMVGWFLVCVPLVPALLARASRLSERTRSGLVGGFGAGQPSDQLRTSAMVISAAVALLVGLAGAAVNLQSSAMPTVAGMSDIDLMVQHVPVDDLPTIRTVPAAAVTQVAGIDGVAAVTPVQMGYASLDGTRILVQAATADSRLPLVQQGRAVAGPLEPGTAYVSTQIADDLGLGAGSTFTLPGSDGQPVSLRVTAVVDSFLWPNGVVVMDIADSERLWGADAYSALEVRADDVPVVQARIRAADGAVASPSLLVATGPEQEAAARSVVVNSAQLYQALSSMAMLVAAIIAAGALALDTSTRMPEYGLVRAVGARRRFLTHMVLSRGAVLVASGTLVGWAFGILLQYYLARTSAATQSLPIDMHWTLGPTLNAITAGIGILVLGSAGSLLTLRRMNALTMLGTPD